MATVTTIATELMQEFGVDTDDTDYNTLVKRWIRDTYRDILDFYPWPFLNGTITFNTADGTSAYTLTTSPTGTIVEISAMVNHQDDPIHFIEYKRLVDLGVDLAQEGLPRHWYNLIRTEPSGADTLGFSLWPVPTEIQTYTVFIQRKSSELADGDHIPLPSDFLSIVKDGAKVYMYENDGDTEYARTALDRYMRKLQQASQRNHNPAGYLRLRVSDIPRQNRELLPTRLPPDHFSN